MQAVSDELASMPIEGGASPFARQASSMSMPSRVRGPVEITGLPAKSAVRISFLRASGCAAGSTHAISLSIRSSASSAESDTGA